MKKHESNIQFVKRFMSETHLNEVIVIQALAHYSEEVIKNKKQFLDENKNNAIISPQYLLAAIEDLKSQLENHLK
ncbi:MAG: hypothetical protein IT280_13180 [Ignavibacteria bacterium]|nr:hypothetical protein [Ignavibacteria bacterium]